MLATAGGLVGAGLAHLARPDDADATGGSAGPVLPAPRPIPGVLPGTPFHVFLPGPPGATLPISGLPLGGLDVEPSTMTDFAGTSALAYLNGTARGSDGAEYGLEVDVRVFEGDYVGADGRRHRGAFSFI
jgi:hypothetical protein